MSSLAVGELQQKDNLCGPFHAARVLRDAGVLSSDGEPVDQDLVALHAGTLLPRRELGPQVPDGAANLTDYRYELGRAEPVAAGTTPAGLAAAIERLSEGALVPVPLSGRWSASVVEGLLEGVGPSVRLLANVRTGLLWGSQPPVDALLDVLDGAEVPDPPAADWDVGHFVELVQLVHGRGGTLVVVRDSYPNLGWSGVHLQPPDAVAAALTRGDGRAGGVLAVAPPAAAAQVRELARELELACEIWDNSTDRREG
jgi:hypothetical protein